MAFQRQEPQRMNRLEQWFTHVSNQRTCFGFGFLLMAIHMGLIAERVYQYRRSCAWIIMARACGQCLHFDCSLVLLLSLRRTITRLRTAGLDWLLPLDRHVYFHKMVGWTVCVFSLIHTLAHIVNFAFLSREKGVHLSEYLFVIDLSAGWFPGLATPSGFALLIILVIMGLFSHRVVRKSGCFEVFYWTHLLCVPFFLLLILHGVNAWKWVVGPFVIFAVEVACRIGFICSGRGRTHITSLSLLPNQVVQLRIDRPPDFEFYAGDYLYVNIPHVARFEWHPFTISSAPEDEDYLTLHVRVAGGWTRRLYTTCQEGVNKLHSYSSEQRIANQIASNLESSPKLQSLTWHVQNASPNGNNKGKDNPAYQPEFCSLQISGNSSNPKSDHNDKQLFQIFQLSPIEMPILLDGPYSGSSTRAWKCRQVLFIAGGIGVTPFASLLQSVMRRYQNSMSACPNCSHLNCSNLPASMGKLRHVDFMWINRDLMSFQWFLELLLDLDREKRAGGGVMDKFLDIRLYQTGAKTLPVEPGQQCTSCSADPTTETAERCSCTIRRMSHLLRFGRPVWDEVFQEIKSRSVGKVTVFYCGPTAMGRVIMGKCKKIGFDFTKEIS